MSHPLDVVVVGEAIQTIWGERFDDEDSTIVELEVSGVFQLDKFDQFLQGLDEVLPVDVVHYSDRYVIVGSGRQAKFIGKSVLPEVRTSH